MGFIWVLYTVLDDKEEDMQQGGKYHYRLSVVKDRKTEENENKKRKKTGKKHDFNSKVKISPLVKKIRTIHSENKYDTGIHKFMQWKNVLQKKNLKNVKIDSFVNLEVDAKQA